MVSLKITVQEEGQRFDKFLLKYLNQSTKSFLYKMLRKKNIKLNNKKAQGNEKLAAGDVVDIYLSDDTVAKFRTEISTSETDKSQRVRQLPIVYEDEDILCINKPVAVLSQKVKKDDYSVDDFVKSYVGESRAFRPGICNRLDRNTSGIIMAGKTLRGATKLSDEIKNRRVKKYYLTIVAGVIEKPSTLRGWLVKDEKSNQVTISEREDADGDYVETAYEPLSNNGEFTLLKIDLITGKSHQIRAHLASMKAPVIGDHKYGDVSLNRQMKEKYGLQNQLLHSWKLCFGMEEEPFEQLSGKTVEAPVPKLFDKIMKDMQLSISETEK